jgi:hypothetical protein
MAMRDTFADNEAKFLEQSKLERTIIIVLAVIVILLALVVAALLFKIREMYENAEDMMIPSQPRPERASREKPGGQKPSSPPKEKNSGGIGSTFRRPSATSRPLSERPPGQRPPKRAEALDESKTPRSLRGETGDSEAKASDSEGVIGRRPTSSRPDRRPGQADEKSAEERKKAQNFLAEDDEFEFEFLKIDD